MATAETKKTKKIILITGASRGIGKVTADYLEKKGYIVYGTSRTGIPPEEFKENKNTVRQKPLLKLNVDDMDSVRLCVQTIMDIEGKIDVLINNAGYGLAGAIKDTKIEDAKAIFETNFFGVHRMILAVIPHMLKRNAGYIINIGSFGGRVALPYHGFYSATKAALAMYTDALRMELVKTNIKIAHIEPGDIKTDFHSGRKYVAGFSEDEVAQRVIQKMHESEKKGTPPLKVAQTIEKILRSKKPKPRYLVGKDAKMFGFLLRLVSQSRREKMTLKYYGLNKNK